MLIPDPYNFADIQIRAILLTLWPGHPKSSFGRNVVSEGGELLIQVRSRQNEEMDMIKHPVQ